MPAAQGGEKAAPTDAPEDTPEIAEVMRNLLTSVGSDDYEPQVINMLTDFVYSYARNVLQDAQAYSEAAGQPLGSVNLSDVTLAIRSRTDMSFAHAPSLEVLTSTAASMNKRDLPAVRGKLGLPIPGGDQALLAPNVQFSGWERPDERVAMPVPANGAAALPVPSGLPMAPATAGEAGPSGT